MTSLGAQAEPVPALHFRSADFAEGERYSAFRELVARNVLGMATEPLTDGPVYGDLKLRGLPDLSVLCGRGSGSRFLRTKSLIDSDDFSLVMNWHPWCMSQFGREAALGAGDAVLHAHGAVFTATLPAWDGILLRIPRTAVAPLVPDVDAVVACPIPARSPALQLLVKYFGILRNAQAMPELQRLFATHVHDLVAMALGATRDAAETARDRGVRAARVQAIVAEIRQGFADPRFSPTVIAGKLGLSPRSVQDLLQETGLPFTDRVIALRLERARALLEGSANRQRKIIDIAYSCGFNDLSYFNRCFRRRFGATPAQCRGARSD